MEKTEIYGSLLNGQDAGSFSMQHLPPDAGKKKLNRIEQFLEDTVTSLISLGRYELVLKMLDDVKYTYSNYEHYKSIAEIKYRAR